MAQNSFRVETRETVETVAGAIYWSDDNWQTIHRRYRSTRRYGLGAEDVPQLVNDKREADRVRYLAVIKYGGGRDDH